MPGYSFTDPKTKSVHIFSPGDTITGLFVPTPANSAAMYTYTIMSGSTKKTFTLPGNAMTIVGSVLSSVVGDAPSPITPPPPPASNKVATPPSIPQTPTLGVSQTSDGSVYMNPSGGQLIQVPAGQPVPDLWVKQTTPPPASATVVQAPPIPQNIASIVAAGGTNLSDGGVYMNPSNKAYVQIPAGNPVPDLWIRIGDESVLPQGTPVVQMPDLNAAVKQAQVASSINAAIPIIGAAGFAYLAYLIIMKPSAAEFVISRLTAFKDVVVDSAWIAVAGGILVAGGFVSYEFYEYYNHYGTVGKALEYMTEDTITNVLGVIVDVLIGAAKAIINFWNKSGLLGSVVGGINVITDVAGGMSAGDAFKDSFTFFTGGLDSGPGKDDQGWTQ
jgi:hypothetical protein